MVNGVTLITCTGGRPESLARCEQYVARFENPNGVNVQWLVVNDTKLNAPERTSESYDLTLACPRILGGPGINTLPTNLLTAIDYAHHENILFIEDDDWYAPSYMRSQLMLLRSAEIVGEIPSRYYHVPTRKWRVMHGPTPSLCQTGIRASMLPALKAVCTLGLDFIDVRLWQSVGAALRSTTQMTDGSTRCVGIKGMPGRLGIGIGHRPDLGAGWTHDPSGVKLREWLIDDADAYIGLKQAV